MSTRGIIGLILFVGAFYLIVDSMIGGGAYFLTVDEVLAAQDEGKLQVGRKVRIKGLIAHGTHQNESGSSEHRFVVEGEVNKVSVYFKGAIPDVFKEGGEVVATGSFDEKGILIATEVTAKCPSKYEKDKITPEARKNMGIDGQRKMR